MSKALKKYITVDREILGGTPVISGTRIPVERIYELIKQGHSLEALKDEYSWVDEKKIQFTIAYLMKAGLNEFEKVQKI
ncbi:MAG: DUF433 domain-containing protein [Candidatus Daviesbacteria bacterium]|nr:DUF433 domain-containing protein [Candidatus Daviesbacteria bacterium]